MRSPASLGKGRLKCLPGGRPHENQTFPSKSARCPLEPFQHTRGALKTPLPSLRRRYDNDSETKTSLSNFRVDHLDSLDGLHCLGLLERSLMKTPFRLPYYGLFCLSLVFLDWVRRLLC